MFHQSGTLFGSLLLFTTTLISRVSGFGLGAVPLAPAYPPVQTANKTGPYSVGVLQQAHIFDGVIFNYYYYYPATPAVGAPVWVSNGGIKGQAVENAPLNKTGGPYPLIVFAPGVAAYADAYYFYCQNLASHGYIVMSLEQLDTKRAIPTQNTTLQAQAVAYQVAGQGDKSVETLYTEWFRSTQFGMSYRPQEIEFALDTVLFQNKNPLSPFYNTIDKENIGMTGHSLGAYYTMVVGGGLPIYCDYSMTPAELDPNNTALVNVSPCAFPARQKLSSPFGFKDPLSRFKAIIPLAAPFFIADSQIPRSAAQIKIPMMVLTRDDLQLESTRAPQYAAFQNAAGPSHWVMVANTSHYLVSDNYQLNPTFSQQRLTPADQANFLDKAAVYMTYSAAFFNAYLKNSTAAKATLRAPISSYVVGLESRNA